MEKFEKPWQAMPSRIISLALRHAEKTTDFDHQLAFLLLDIGVESTLKTYLINRKVDVEKIVFPDLLKLVSGEADKNKLPFPGEEIKYFHNIRNKLYHQGDGVKPTEENLKKYAKIAKELLNTLLDVDVEKEGFPSQSVHTLLDGVRENIASLHSNSSLLVEHLYPQIALRKIEAQLRYIRTKTGPDNASYPPLVKAEFRHQRIDAFNKITGWEFIYDEDVDYEGVGDYVFVEYIIDHPEQLHVWLAFQEINSDDWSEDWEAYKHMTSYIKRCEHTINENMEDKYLEEIWGWTNEKATMVCQWIKSHMPDVELIEPDCRI